MAGRRRQQASTRDPEYELRIELAVQQLRDGTHKTINAAAKANQVARQTLSDRFNGLHKSIRHAHHDARLLNAAQENVVNEWLVLKSDMASPLHPRDLRARVFDITDWLPGKNWHRRYLKRHSETLKTSKPRHLDPKRAQNFNQTNVDGYFRLRAQIEKKYGDIPPEHNWNEDEKGNQMGGGCIGLGMKYIYSAEDRERYRQHSDNLELVTILE